MGDINITGKYRVNGVPITTGEVGQTPWHSNIDAAQHDLFNLKHLKIVNNSDNYPVYFGTGSCARYIFYNHSGSGGGGDRSSFLKWIQSRENGGSSGSGNACNIGFADNNGNERLFLRHDGISVADGGMYVHGDLDVSGNYKQAGVIREFPPTHTSSNNNQVLTIYNNKMEWRTPGTGGESQTPWLHNIDAANHTLTNLASLNGHSIIFVPSYSSSNNNQVLTVISGALQWHTAGGGQNQTPWLSNIDAASHTLTNLASLNGHSIIFPPPFTSANNNQVLTVVNNALVWHTPTGGVGESFWQDAGGGAIYYLGRIGVGTIPHPAVAFQFRAAPGQNLAFSAGQFTDGVAIQAYNDAVNTYKSIEYRASLHYFGEGMVGINVNTPQYRLDVSGDCNIRGGGVYRLNGVQQYFVPNPAGVTNGYILTANNSAAQWMAPPAGGSTGFNLKGFVDKHQDLPTTGNSVGDAYVTENSGELWVWDGDHWFNAGKFTPEIDVREHQSPWLVDIDADDHNLINVSQIDCSSIYIDGAPVPLPSHIVLNTGSYANPAWITSLAWSKITGAPTIPASYWTAWGAGAIYTNDKVGVNTNELTYRFEVSGRIRLKPYSSETAGIWFNAIARADAFFLGENNGDFRLYSAYSAANVLYFTGSTNRAGFNMAAPQYTIDANGDINCSGVYRIAGAAKSFPPTPTTGNNGDVLSVNSVGAMVWSPPAVGHTPINYSTTEQDTGIRWTDNKVVYQKTIVYPFETIHDFYDIPHGVSPMVVLLIDFFAVFYNMSNQQIFLPYAGHLGASIGVSIVGNNIRFTCNGTNYLPGQIGEIGQVYITIRYIKN